MKQEGIKIYEVKIQTIILYHTFGFVDDYDFECNVPSLIEELFRETKIDIKKDKKGIIELEVLDVKRVRGRPSKAMKKLYKDTP